MRARKDSRQQIYENPSRFSLNKVCHTQLDWLENPLILTHLFQVNPCESTAYHGFLSLLLSPISTVSYLIIVFLSSFPFSFSPSPSSISYYMFDIALHALYTAIYLALPLLPCKLATLWCCTNAPTPTTPHNRRKWAVWPPKHMMYV